MTLSKSKTEHTSMKLTFLGTGTSCGVPVLGCNCGVCQSKDAKDKRLRCAAMLETSSTRLLIDCGPDFRQQMMGRPFKKIDGVLVTHAHYDHVGGLDDVRPYCKLGDIDVYANETAIGSMRQMMPYCFPPRGTEMYPGVPKIQMHTVAAGTRFTIGDIEVMPVNVMHDQLPILGYRFGNFAYITDIKTIDFAGIELLQGVHTLVVSALRFEKAHHSHFLVDDAIDFAARVGARQVYLTHVCHDMGCHEEADKKLPTHVHIAFDNEVIEL